MRAVILVMDSVGIGGAPDAPSYGDEGADTLGHIAEACALGDADNSVRQGPLRIPHLAELGMGEPANSRPVGVLGGWLVMAAPSPHILAAPASFPRARI